MGCAQLPPLPRPPLPPGITVPLPTIPGVPIPPFGEKYCCSLSVVVIIPPTPLGALVMAIPGVAAVMALLGVIEDGVIAYLDALIPDCPFDQ